MWFVVDEIARLKENGKKKKREKEKENQNCCVLVSSMAVTVDYVPIV